MEGLITRQEAARLLGLEPQTLAKWAMTSKNLNVIRLGKRSVRYRVSDIEEFIQRSMSQSGSTMTEKVE